MGDDSFTTLRLQKALIANGETSHVKVVPLAHVGPSQPSSRIRWSDIGQFQDLQQLIDVDQDATYLITIYQSYTFGRLDISNETLDLTISHYGLSPRLRQFLAFFGPEHGESALSPPIVAFNHSTNEILPQIQNATTSEVGSEPKLPHELIYVLRLPERHDRDGQDKPFDIRQVLIYYHCTVGVPAAFLITAGTAEIATKWVSDFRGFSRNDDIAYWRFHLGILEIAIAAWRPYIAWISDELRKQSMFVFGRVKLSERDIEEEATGVRKSVKRVDDQLAEILLNLQQTLSTIRILRRQYSKIYAIIISQPDMSPPARPFDAEFLHTIEQMEDSLQNYMDQITSLSSRAKNTSDLLSNMLELNNTSRINKLQEASAVDSIAIGKLTAKATNDAAAVKVLSVLTMIYLPFTVVMTFYSASFMDTKETPDGKTVLYFTEKWWVSLAVAIPLTLGTLFIWYMFVQRELKGGWCRFWLA